MKLIAGYLGIFLTLNLIALSNGQAQEKPEFVFTCDIHRVFNQLTISRTDLEQAVTLSDLNRHYEADWVKEYYAVEIETLQEEKLMIAKSKSYNLSQEQKDLMLSSDNGKEIKVRVIYLPDNTLSVNDPKEINFSFLVDPERMAEFAGGSADLTQYLKESILGEVDRSVFKQHQLTAIKFTIDKEGSITDAHVFQSSDDMATDKLLLQAICDMPQWTPAEYQDGLRIAQEYVLTIGDEYSCVMNLLNIDASKLLH